MIYKVKVTYTNRHDETLSGGDWNTYYESEKYPDYFREFNTKEELGVFILDLADKENEEVIVSPINSTEEQDYRVIEVYNDYRE